MPTKQYEHVLTLKITGQMRDEIDSALLRMKGVIAQSRSEFLRAAVKFALASMAEPSSADIKG